LAATATARQESFVEGERIVQIADPATRAALHELAGVAPRLLRFDELVRRCLPAGASELALRALASELFDVWLATGALDLHDHDPLVRVASVAGDRPVACPVARGQALRGDPVTNRLHQEVLVPDAVVRFVLGRLDGTRSRRDLAREARVLDANRALTDAELGLLVDASIERLVACALVVEG
jgi:hypothetical protein